MENDARDATTQPLVDDPGSSTHLRTAWHPVLIAVLEHLLPADVARVIAEYALTREPRRIDAVVVRRATRGAPWRPEYLRSVLDGMRDHTIVHFKGATDELERADALQLLSYAFQYMALEGVADPGALALRVVAPTLTPRFADQCARLGGALSATATPGVHEGSLAGFSMRVVEADVAWRVEHEHALFAVTRGWPAHPERVMGFDDRERKLFYHLAQYVAKLASDPKWKAVMKDSALVESAADTTLDELFALRPDIKLRWLRLLNPRERLAGLVPEEVLAGLAPEERLAGLAPEERLAGLAPEERLAGLDPAHQVLALSDEVLRGFAPAYLATLPDDVQAKVRARIGGTSP